MDTSAIVIPNKKNNIPNQYLPAAVILSALAYVDDPNGTAPNGQLNIEAAVQAIYPKLEVVWSASPTYYDNYAYIVHAGGPDNLYFMAIRGSLPFEVNGEVVIDWGTISNWLLEDFAVYSQDYWPYVNTGTNAYIASGTMAAFTDVQTSPNSIGSAKETAYAYLLDNAIQQNLPVYITGHSLGGNVANVYASYFAQQILDAGLSNKDNFLFSFAAPVAGEQNFVDDLQAKFPPGQSYHYQINNDIIPHFPVIAAVEELENMFQPTPLASSISYLGVTVADLIQVVVDTLLADIDADIIDPYVATPVNWGTNNLLSLYLNNTFDDWFSQAAYQHQVTNYLNIFWSNSDALTPVLAQWVTKAKSLYQVKA